MLFQNKQKTDITYQEMYFNNMFSPVLSGMMRHYGYDKPATFLSSSQSTSFVHSSSFDKVIEQAKIVYLEGALNKDSLFNLLNSSKWIQKFKSKGKFSFNVEDLDFNRFEKMMDGTRTLNKMEPNTDIHGRQKEFYETMEPLVQKCFMLRAKMTDIFYPFPDFQKGQPYYERTFGQFQTLCEQNKHLTARQALAAVLDYSFVAPFGKSAGMRDEWNTQPYEKLDNAYSEFVKKCNLLSIKRNTASPITKKSRRIGMA